LENAMSRVTSALVAAVLAALLCPLGDAHGAPAPREVFDGLRQLQADKRYTECVTQGEAAIPSMPEWTAIWHIVGECYAADDKPCEADAALRRFLDATQGASPERIAEASQLADVSRARCAQLESDRACAAAYAAGDWATCSEACMGGDNPNLPRARAEMLTKCLLRQGRCDEATTQLAGRDPSVLDPEDQMLLSRCGGATDPVIVPPREVRPDESGEGASITPYVVGGLGIGAVVAGAVFLGLTQADADAIAGLRSGPRYDAEYDELKRDYDTHLVAGYSLLGVGLAATGVGLALLLFDSEPTPAAPSTRSTLVVPAFDAHGFHVQARVGF